MSVFKVSSSKTRNLIYCSLFAGLITVGAFIRIPLPFIPITLQFLFTNLAGLLLGPILGATAVSVYIIIGLIGLPVFTVGGGLGSVLQPTFGYIIGFACGAWVGGHVAHRKESPSNKRLFMAGISNLAVLYLFGTVWYYFLAKYYLGTPKGIWTLFVFCVAVFIPGNLLSCILSVPIAKRLLPLIKVNK
ncbi:MAG: biotin transporter BioY [Synergistaceae bacterium]|nr:biotin transporter BioY [Synergistaceae bacterium]